MFTLALLVRSLANDSSCGCRIFLRASGATKSSSASVNEGATKGLHFFALGSMLDSFSVSTRLYAKFCMLNSGLRYAKFWAATVMFVDTRVKATDHATHEICRE